MVTVGSLPGGRCTRLGSRSRGYHPVIPRPIAAGPLCSAIWFRPSSTEALDVMRHERPVLVKDGIKGEKWPVNLACDSDFHVNHRVLTCRKSATWDRQLYFPSEGWHAVDFFRPGSNPRSWVPEASMLITRPPKPLLPGGKAFWS
jgi:hypothetical protein